MTQMKPIFTDYLNEYLQVANVGAGSARPATSTYVFVGAFRAGKPLPLQAIW